MTIFYADDDQDDRDFFSEAFMEIDRSIICHTVSDGRKLLSSLGDANTLPDVIFLDINMPIMNGRECLAELKKDDRFREIPVIIYTTTSDYSEVKALYKLGAEGYIQKPDSLQRLTNVLSNFRNLFLNKSVISQEPANIRSA
jgi:CheY-like chemotaxis protein